MRRPSVSASETPVIVVAAVFQSLITPSRSTRTTPSPTASSARAARLRRSTSAYSRALSIAAAACRASSCARAASSSPYTRPDSAVTSVIEPITSPRAVSGTVT